MKTLFLSVFICSLSLINSYAQKQVTIDGIVLAAPTPTRLTMIGNGLKGYNSVEVWKLRTWQHYQKTKDSATYKAISRVQGRCDTHNYNNSRRITPGQYVFRVINDYKTPSKRKETIKILDTRTEAQKKIKEEVFVKKKVNAEDFTLTAISPSEIKFTEPTYSEFLTLEIWEKEAWHKHLQDKSTGILPRYSRKSPGNIEAGRSKIIEVIPGDYVMSIVLENQTTGERTTHQKILNTEAGKPSEVHGDGFSLIFTPDKN